MLRAMPAAVEAAIHQELLRIAMLDEVVGKAEAS
jgi:hypothetical protein